MIVLILQHTPAWVWMLVAGLVFGFLSCIFPARAHALVRAAKHAPSNLAGQSA